MIYLRKMVSSLSVESYLTFVGNGRKVRSKYKNAETIKWMKWNAWWYVRKGRCEISGLDIIGERWVTNGISRLEFRELYHSLWNYHWKIPLEMTSEFFLSKYSLWNLCRHEFHNYKIIKNNKNRKKSASPVLKISFPMKLGKLES